MSTGQQQTPLRKPPGYRDPGSIPIRRPPPPRNPVALPPSFRPTKRPRKWCHPSFCCCLFALLFTAVVIVSITAAGLLYLWFQPRLPEIHLKSLNIKKFRIRSMSDALPLLDFKCLIRVEIKNPNRNLEVVYNEIMVFLSSDNGDNVKFGELAVPGFVQDWNDVTNLKLAIGTNRKTLNVDDKSAQKLKIGMKRKKLMVKVELKMRGVGFKRRGWVIGNVPVNVVCREMRSSSQNLDFMPKCRIKILNRFYIS